MSGIFHRALGCICTVFRICDCSTSRGHLNPDRSGKKSHKSLRVSSNCHVWWKRWTNMFQDFYQMYPMRLDVCVLPLLESVLNSHNLQRCFDLDFKNWVVSWVFSLLNGLILTQIPVFFLSPKHVASYAKNGCGEGRFVLCVLLITTQGRWENPLNVNWKKF